MGGRRQGRGHAALSTSPAAEPHWAEQLVAEHLERSGWRVLARNYRLRGGELDLVCEDGGGTVVVIEVKQRGSDAFGGAAAAVDYRKLARLRRTASHYLTYALKRPDAPVRFDAVLVVGDRVSHRLEHLQDIA